jgi:hypothetical protein
VDHAAVGDGERPAKASGREIGDPGVEERYEAIPRERTAAAQRSCPDRVEAEADVGRGGCNAATLDERGKPGRRVLGLRAQIQVERDAGVEMDAVERP